MGSSRLSKQDGVYTRTASDLERKYNFGKTFAETIGLVNDSRDHVDSVESSLHDRIIEQATTIGRDTEKIIFEALKTYALTSDVEAFKAELESQIELTASNLSVDFSQYSQQIEDVDGTLKTVIADLEKHFDFGIDGLAIKSGDYDLQLRLDNDVIAFYKGEYFEEHPEINRLGWWDGNNFNCGNIYVRVDERAQFGNYAFIPVEDESVDGLDLVRVGG